MLFRPVVSALKTLTCTLAEAVWMADGSTIPATESTRWGRTLTAEDFPQWSFQPESVKYIGKLNVVIYNNSGSSQTISWKMYKNGTSINSGSGSRATANYHGHTFTFYDIDIGDFLEVAVWTASNTNVTVTGSLYHVVPTRLLPTSKPCIDVSYSFELYTYPSPLSSSTTYLTHEYIGSNIDSSISSAQSRSYNGLSFVSQTNYNLFREGAGDYGGTNTAGIATSSSNSNIRNSHYPTTISYREISRGR